MRVHYTFKRGALHGGCTVVVRYFKIGVYFRKLAVLAQQCGTEAVYRADLRTAAQCALTAQTLTAGIFRKARAELLHDAAAQLTCRSACKGYYEKAVQIRRMLAVTYIRHQAFGQHLGFAASGACRDKHRVAAGVHRGGLRLSGYEFTHVPWPPLRPLPAAGSIPCPALISRDNGSSRRCFRPKTGRRPHNRS